MRQGYAISPKTTLSEGPAATGKYEKHVLGHLGGIASIFQMKICLFVMKTSSPMKRVVARKGATVKTALSMS